MKVTMFSQVSIDGKLTIGKGNSSKELLSLLSKEDIQFIHRFRGNVDGIMVGKNTIEIDNPSLTNRFEENNNPVRIIPTTSLDISENATVLKDEYVTIFATLNKNKDKAKKIERENKICLFCGEQEIDFELLFETLEQQYNIKSIMLEGGGNLNWSLLKRGLVDEIVLMQIPILIGGSDNISLIEGEGYFDLESAKYVDLYSFECKKNLLLLKYKVCLQNQGLNVAN